MFYSVRISDVSQVKQGPEDGPELSYDITRVQHEGTGMIMKAFF